MTIPKHTMARPWDHTPWPGGEETIRQLNRQLTKTNAGIAEVRAALEKYSSNLQSAIDILHQK